MLEKYVTVRSKQLETAKVISLPETATQVLKETDGNINFKGKEKRKSMMYEETEIEKAPDSRDAIH